MKNIKRLLPLFAAVMLLSSCAETWPVAVTDNPIGSKRGVSTSTVLFGELGWFLNSDYGVKDAAKNGKIKGGISTVDEKITRYFFFAKYELIVTGE